jgi:small subunit ribosomal protein S17
MTAKGSTSTAEKHGAAESGANTLRSVRRALEGTVTSNAMAKTITVEVERTYKHAKYGKFVRKAKKYHAHDESGEARRGDRVEIMACRPLSKTKRWRLVRIVEKSRLVDAIEFDVEGQVASPETQEASKESASGKKAASKKASTEKASSEKGGAA